MRLSALGALLVCVSCKLATRASENSSEFAEPVAAPPRATEGDRVLATAALRQRFGAELPRFGDGERRRCPDEQLGANGQIELPIRVRDERLDRRQLLPLRLGTALTSESAARVRKYLDPIDALTQAQLANEVASPDEALELRRLSALHFLGELQVEVYKTPKLFRRKDAPKSEWSPGVLSGRLVVYDLFDAKPLCQTPVEVHVSGDGEPIRKRLRDTVRERLTTELERRTRSELERALASMSSAFTLEPSPSAAPALALTRVQ